jgi:DNA processing protein
MLPAFDTPCVGIVGTRNPTGYARSAAFKLAMDLSSNGVGIVSGLARGIDFEAHSGSLEGKGVPVAVLGNGIDSLYPKSSETLGRKLIERGGVVFSEYPPLTPPLRYHFPARNRIISGLSRSVVIIQAPVKSGALITADYALEQGRELFVHKAGLAGTMGAGTYRLVCEGARAIERASDLFSDWGATIPPSNATVKKIFRGDRYMKPGLRLARLVAGELDDQLVTHNGETSIKGAKQ